MVKTAGGKGLTLNEAADAAVGDGRRRRGEEIGSEVEKSRGSYQRREMNEEKEESFAI